MNCKFAEKLYFDYRIRKEVVEDLRRSVDALAIPFEKIKSATDDFADENLIAQSSSGKLYRGQLLQSEEMIDVLVREVFIIESVPQEMIMLSLHKHKHISSILYCAMNMNIDDNRIIFLINKIEANGSLAEHLSGSSRLTWTQRLSICIGVGQALKYIHCSDFLERDYYVIHGNIKSSEILLDANWQPKLQGFESTMIAERNTVFDTYKYEGTLQYKDPTYEKTGALTSKSDVFAFGVVLFEVLFGRKAAASSPNEQEGGWNFAEFARLQWKNKTVDQMIDPIMRKHMDSKSIEIFSNIAYVCLTEQREERPDMDQVVRELEQSMYRQKIHERSMVTQTSSKHLQTMLQEESFKHLMIPLKDILSATENFNSKYEIGSGGFATVYKAKLEHFESRKFPTIEGGDDVSDMYKISSTVAIKLITSTADCLGEKGFIAEVQMLSKCKHQNIVSLLGFCDEGPQKILIYEYVPNGSLDGYLESFHQKTNLTWGRRIQICLDIAHGLNYLHSGLNGNEIIIHRDIKSANILLDDNLRAKVADFGLSRLHTINSEFSTFKTDNIAGTEFYLDPEYLKTGNLKKASDIYSFGVVLFEISCGKLAYDKTYITETEKGLPSIARRHFKEGELKAIVDTGIKEADGSIFSQSRIADQHSLDIFLNIAYQCLAESQDERPTIEEVIRELEKALNFQKNNQENLQILLEDINLATQNFNDCNCIGEGKFWKLYQGEVPLAISNDKGCTAIVAKRWSNSTEGHPLFYRELDLVFKYKQENAINMVGYCTEMEEKVIVYEHSTKGTLDKHLKDVSLTWMERLKICVDVARGLRSLHGCKGALMMHADIKSSNILIDGDRKTQICNLELSKAYPYRDTTLNLDPSIKTVGKYADRIPLGVLLLEVFSGRLTSEDPCEPLGRFAMDGWPKEEELDEMVFEGIKNQIDPHSLNAFTTVGQGCFRFLFAPKVFKMVQRLEEALEYQKYIEERPKVSFSDVKLLSDEYIQEGIYWKLYEAQIPHANGWLTVYAKCWDNMSREAHKLFFTEIRILSASNSKNIVAFVAYCNEMDRKIIFYEHVSNSSLDKHLDDASLTWKKRLNICIDVAKGLQYLQESSVLKRTRMMQALVVKSGSIVIDSDWMAKIAHLEYYLAYVDEYPRTFFDREYPGSNGWNSTYVDVYSFGVVLLEMLCGRLAWPEGCEQDQSPSLGPLAQRHYHEKGNLDELVLGGIKEQIDPESLIVFQRIAIKCLEIGKVRPQGTEGSEVVKQLEAALELQKYYEASRQVALEEIKQGTQNFSDDKCVGKGKYSKLYEGEFSDGNTEYSTVLVKRWEKMSREGHHEFLAERSFLFQNQNNDNIVGIQGFCIEMNEKIIVYEHEYNRSLDKHLGDASFSWTKRLRICIDVASVVHSLYIDGFGVREIKSGSILINDDWKGKVSNLDLHRNEYRYSPNVFLVLLLDILRGSTLDRREGCESYSRSLTDDVYLDELVFKGIKEKIAPESLNLFIQIVSDCLYSRVNPLDMVSQMGNRLEDALREQEYVEESSQISLEDIKSATHNFSDEKCIAEGGYWKLYEGEFPHANANGFTTALVKRWDSKSSQGRKQFFSELKLYFRFKKNDNIVAVEGYCSEKDEKIIVFEHGYNTSLDKHLDDTSLSWKDRLNICINVACVLDICHNTDPTGLPSIIHGDIRSGSILIDGDKNIKVYNFEVTDNKADTSPGYVDPQPEGSGMHKDTYAFGVVLLEMLCEKLAWPEGCEGHSQSLGPLAQRHYKAKGNLDELVFGGIKEQIAPESLIKYQEIVLKCITNTEDMRPIGPEMVKQLKNALELQEDYEIWNSKLPEEYKQYIQMSKTPERYSTEVAKDLYNILTKGILLQQGKLWFTIGANGERNEMISATTFSYKNRPSRKWESIPESRFRKVAQIWDISNLNIQIRVKTQFLSPEINYGVHLVFKFVRSRKARAEREYVDLTYKMGEDNLHTYFASWRDDEWMMIELCRFSNDKKDVNFEAVLKSFSRCYCGSSTIYVEGIEFRSINNVTYEETNKSKNVQQVLKSSLNMDEVQQSTIEFQEISKIHENDGDDKKMFIVNQRNIKKHLRLSPMEFLYQSCNMKPFHLNPSSLSRSQQVEFLPQQVFGIKCKIESHMLSPDTDYMCCLIFKFSEKCNGLHGPVIIRDRLNWKDKDTGTLYFRSPSPWNLHETDWVPRERKDGLMEVIVWKFNSKSKLRNGCVPMNLKLITYNGTMSGLIVCSLEMRPI